MNDRVPVAIVMGSRNDWSTLQEAAGILDELQVAHHVEVVSAHRTPRKLYEFAESAAGRGFEVIIAGAGGAAHLPGMIASLTPLPVLGVPVKSAALNGVDSMLSILQMPRGVAVGTMAIGAAGAFNAGLFATQILATRDESLMQRLEHWRKAQSDQVLAQPDPRKS